jgi:hypothetical protein
VIQDGHEFYVYVSIALFGVHDQHQNVRQRLWDMFSRLAWKLPLSTMMTPATRTPGLCLDNEEARPLLDACIAYLGLERQARLDFSVISEQLRRYVMRQTHEALTAPLLVMCPLVARVYHLGVVLYDAGNEEPSPRGSMPPSSKPLAEAWHPVRTWQPPEDTLPPVRYLHLLQRKNTLQMLVNRKTDADDVRVLVPTRVVGSLPAELKTHHLFEAASSKSIDDRATYRLNVFDCKQRCNLVVGSFVSPKARQDPQIQTLHYMRVDMTISCNSDYIFVIEGCQEVRAGSAERGLLSLPQAAVPIHIYGCSSQGGTQASRCATLIGHWRVDHTSPRVILRKTDDALLIVPNAASREAADACVRLEWKCLVISRE